MIKTINFTDFCDAFAGMDRQDNFTYEGKRALFDYLEASEEDTGTPIELDVIALCCEYTEYKDMEEVHDNYTHINSMDELQNATKVIEFDGGIIIQDF